MTERFKVFIGFFLFTFGAFSTSLAQLFSPGYEVGANVSAFIYQGDLTPARLGSYRTLRPGIGVTGARLISPYWSVRAGITVAGLRGNDSKYSHPEYRQQRNFRFSSVISELSAVAIYNIAGTNGDHQYRHISPYVFGGIGCSFLKTSRDYSDFNANYFGVESWVVEGLAADRARNPTRRLLVFPVGAGLRYPITEKLSLSLETNYRISFTDYLDGFSKAAGPTKQDHYYSHTASLLYSFGSNGSIKCPVIRP